MLLAALAVAGAMFGLTMEWLFFVTKPSFLASVGWQVRFLVLVGALAPAGLLALAPVGALRLLGLASRRGRLARWSFRAGTFVPAIAFGTTYLLLIDNFTYTLFRFGILSGGGFRRIAWALLHLGLVLWAGRGIRRTLETLSPRGARRLVGSTALILALSLALSAAAVVRGGETTGGPVGAADTPARLPNILILVGDSIEAARTSLYGYKRDTTPTLRALAAESLVAENCVVTSPSTFTSTAALLTGRPPTATRMVFPPNILQGADAYLHLPALLRGFGYRTLNVSIRHFGDPFEMNMRNSFDRANFREFSEGRLAERLAGAIGQRSAYFIDQVLLRVYDRASLLYLGRRGDNAFQEAMQGTKGWGSDEERMVDLMRFIDASPRPFFVQAHLFVTHGPSYHPRRRVFSTGVAAGKNRGPEFADDALLDFDDRVRAAVEHLRRDGRLENTVLVVFGDHGPDHKPDTRVPLLVRFPRGEHAGSVRENVQLIDLAPTLLDYLGVRTPEWMEGRSLLAGERDRYRPIWGAEPGKKFNHEGWLEMDPGSMKAPFFGLGSVTMIRCQRTYRLDLGDGSLLTGVVEGHTDPCPDEDIPVRDREATALIRERLQRDGYDVAAIPTKAPPGPEVGRLP